MKVFHCPPCTATCCLPVTHAADFYQCSMTDALSWWQRAHFWHPKQRQFVERSDCWLSALFILITANSALWLIGIRTSIYLPVYLMKSGRLPLSFGAVKAQWCCVCIYTENMQGLRKNVLSHPICVWDSDQNKHFKSVSVINTKTTTTTKSINI